MQVPFPGRPGSCQRGAVFSQKPSVNLTNYVLPNRSLRKFGPLFSLSFLTFWFPFLPSGIQFVCCLCLYDGFLTLVDLHHQALLADMAITSNDRSKLNSYCSICSALGSASVFISYAVWDKSKLFPFQMLCLTVASAVIVGFLICCSILQWEYEDRKMLDDAKETLSVVIHERLLSSNFVFFNARSLYRIILIV